MLTVCAGRTNKTRCTLANTVIFFTLTIVYASTSSIAVYSPFTIWAFCVNNKGILHLWRFNHPETVSCETNYYITVSIQQILYGGNFFKICIIYSIHHIPWSQCIPVLPAVHWQTPVNLLHSPPSAQLQTSRQFTPQVPGLHAKFTKIQIG